MTIKNITTYIIQNKDKFLSSKKDYIYIYNKYIKDSFPRTTLSAFKKLYYLHIDSNASLSKGKTITPSFQIENNNKKSEPINKSLAELKDGKTEFFNLLDYLLDTVKNNQNISNEDKIIYIEQHNYYLNLLQKCIANYNQFYKEMVRENLSYLLVFLQKYPIILINNESFFADKRFSFIKNISLIRDIKLEDLDDILIKNGIKEKEFFYSRYKINYLNLREKLFIFNKTLGDRNV